jgi:hypothetical protein
MQSLCVRRVLHLGIGLLAPFVIAAAGPGRAATLDPTAVQVQYMPRDGAAIVLWNAVDNATGYNVYEQIVTAAPGNPATATAAVKVNKDPIAQDIHSLMVDNLKNGTPYHFTVTAIVGGAETDPVGPSDNDPMGALVAVVPQTPVKLAGMDGFYGYNIGTDLPGSHTIATDPNTGATTITMSGSGWDINSPADGFYFLAAPVKGDITVTARIVSGPTTTANQSTWNLGGPQIRANLDSGAVLAMTQAASAGRAQFKYRDTYGGGGNEEDEDDTVDGHAGGRRPLWLRVIRKGNDFHGQLSDDGKTWTTLDSTGSGGTHTVMDMPNEAYVGLSISAHDDGELSTATFDNFTITSP